MKLELYEIWQTEAKRLSKQLSLLCYMVPLENDEFLHLRPKNCDFSVYSNICLFNNFLLKSHNKVPLVLKRPLRSVVYDSAFNLKFPFLVNFGILLPNRIINVN